MKIKNTSTVTNNKLNIFIYGESGAGKTTLASTIPVKTLVISAESGLLSIKGKNIDYIDISVDDEGNLIPKENRFDRLGEVFAYLQTEQARNTYQCIFLDSLTEMSQCLIDSLKVKYPNKSDSLKLYGENSDLMLSLIKAFRDIPYYHVVVVALSKLDKDETGKRFFSVDVVGKAADKVVGFFDEVFFLGVVQGENGEKRRILVTDKTDKVTAKDRSSKLLPVEEANLSVIFNKILN